MDRDAVAAYLHDTRDVEGWFFPIDAWLFAYVDEIQKRGGIRGNLFEIGVHHGKTALFLARAAAPGEVVGVCDVFEQQDLNRDRSGEGNRAIFLEHLRRHGGPVDLRIFVKTSDSLTREDTTTSCRFVHIDGGHRPEDVMNDLAVADAALLPDGVVALDDLFNPNWPGVSEGFYRFIAAHPGVFTPIFIGGNKVLFARPGAVARYDFAEIGAFVATEAFTFGEKEWLGARVLTAIRLSWVDLDPEGAARLHR